jgi:hypothetical protein
MKIIIETLTFISETVYEARLCEDNGELIGWARDKSYYGAIGNVISSCQLETCIVIESKQ